jgi:ribosomal protein L32
MAVPKKRTSKSKKNLRKSVWKKKVEKKVQRALFIAQVELKNLPETDSKTSNV